MNQVFFVRLQSKIKYLLKLHTYKIIKLFYIVEIYLKL